MRTSTAKVWRTFLTVVGGLDVSATATAGSLAMHAAKVVALANVRAHIGIDLYLVVLAALVPFLLVGRAA